MSDLIEEIFHEDLLGTIALFGVKILS